MKTVQVRNITLGEGRPKICVPIVGQTKDDILLEAGTFARIPVDVVEWRVDWFEDVFDTDKVLDVAKDLQTVLKDTPILFTFRTAKEGGEKAISNEAYKALNMAVAKSGYVDLIDVEAFTGEEIVKSMIQEAHSYGVKVIASNHDFDATPEKYEIVRRLRMMQDYGADIPKMAVMPRNKQDVLTLLSARWKCPSSSPTARSLPCPWQVQVLSAVSLVKPSVPPLPSVQLPKLPHRDRSMSTSLHRFLTLSTKACDPVTSHKKDLR